MISEEMIKNAATEADQAIRDWLPAPAKCEQMLMQLSVRLLIPTIRRPTHCLVQVIPYLPQSVNLVLERSSIRLV